ncbi:tripartite-type tricarboxylate transporter receptor subunit TctC [Acidovorax sp. 99]|jgi:tripartite-type tricarboxylate transporter receptor subunit TctC|uniref:Bug family tripartite tricarboxylate transporter substrate binding protein n=1 Tax=unclassified Acidovorax TaxID=2684926 RepID=UPI000C19BB70|nr:MULTISPECIES: tripartite tricarboxylate transporter substrate binding protein [unclassified Acidovorax]PIF19779.1 tripartite-type tricarboxylate transporter receptor subunit TctC [Acidovorax sp. 59]PKW01196.1 tripartite-type tricarboxylate transporter receptor subunit TctC [Acidovorax sp. 30]PVY91551.1 tripartite-type tricarboxylate transporter receptor subunit TctC [Acidovorax sp. 99]
MQRHLFLRAALGVATLAMAASSFAQAYPTKPIRMVIPFPPGGTLDTVGRMLAQKLGDQMGQNFIVENKAGGNGVIGGDVVAKAPADGYTLLFNASTFTTAPMTMKSVPYGVVKDFTPVALVAKAPLSVAINKNLPVTDIKSLMAYAKANPGKMTFAVGSIGSAGHLSTELLKRAGNLDYLIVPYKGTAPAFQDLIGGQIDGFIDPILGSLQYHKSGMLRVVAVTSAQRAASLPDVPTVGETIPGYEFYSWYGLWGPAKLPADITQRLNTEVNKALAEMTPKLKEQGLLTTPGSVEDFAKFQRSDMERSQKIVTEGNIRVE